MVKARLKDPFYKEFLIMDCFLEMGKLFMKMEVVLKDLLNLDNLQGKDNDKKKIKQLKKENFIVINLMVLE